MAAVASAEAPCWCTHVSFPEELLASVPLGDRGKACICQLCVEVSHPSGGGVV